MMLSSLPLGTTAFYAFRQSDGFGKIIVIVLVACSVYVWTTMIERGIVIRRARLMGHRFLKVFRDAVSPLEPALQIERFGGPITQVYQAGVDELVDILGLDPQLIDTYCRQRKLPRNLTQHEVDKIRSTLERTADYQVLQLEHRLGMLGTAVTVSPFLGLLGTVWGVMVAFVSMAQKGSPDIRAMAPGVSGALLTTVVGLLVAIPAVIGYNIILSSIRQTTMEMDNFVQDFVALLKLQTGDREAGSPHAD